jgi:Na+/melibiose symporter-like transporter
MAGSGAAAGVLLGGILTRYAGWEWIFFVNVPVGALVFTLTRPLVRESRISGLRGFDAGGAITATGHLALLVYAISKAPDVGLGSGRTIGLLVASGVLLATFVLIESRHESPMVPFRIFRTKTVTGANMSGFLLGAVIYANFFVLTLYVQQVLGYSALKTGLTFLATAGTVIPVAGASQALTTKFGPRPVLAVGLALMTGGMLWYTQIPVHGSFAGSFTSCASDSNTSLRPWKAFVASIVTLPSMPVTLASASAICS